MNILIKNGRVVDPGAGLDGAYDILVENGKIAAVEKKIDAICPQVIDAKGKVVVPGLIDMHVHLREPGREDEETIQTGARAAVHGGFTSIVCMGNTMPVVDHQEVVGFILAQARRWNLANIYPIGCVTKGRKGEEISEFGELRRAGVVGLSDDGSPVMNAETMRRALEYAKMFDLPIISHCEDTNLTAEGVINEGFVSTTLGLPGMPAVAEEVMVSRDILLANMTKSRVHIAHVTTKGSVQLIREAKVKGVPVTCETCPHYFTLTDEAVRDFNTNTKMNPPLRTKEDMEMIKEGLKDGTIDVISSDHAPHTSVEKDVEYNLAPFGIIGLETSVSLVLDKLVKENVLKLSQAIAKMTINPAGITGIPKGTLKKGRDADITVLDLNKIQTVDVKSFESKSRNSPFGGWKLEGAVSTVIVGGRILVRDAKIVGDLEVS